MIDTILVVEDEKMIRQGIATMIKRSGVEVGEVLECPDGEKALDILKSRNIDVVFTDIRMPKLNGIELVQRMQELDHIPLAVAISGYDDFSYAVEMLRQGVKEYILKPVEREKLKQVMHKLEDEIIRKKVNESMTENTGNRLLKYLLLDKDAAPEELNDLKNLLADHVGGEYRVLISSVSYGDIGGIGIANGGEVISIIPVKEAEKFVNNERKGGYAGISAPHSSVDELKAAYEEAYIRRRRAFLENTDTVAENGKDAPARFIEDSRRLTEASAISAAVQRLGVAEEKEILKDWQRFFTAAGRGYIPYDAFERAIRAFCEEYTSFYKKEIPDGLIYPYAAACLEDYEDKFLEFIRSAVTGLKSEDGDSELNRKLRDAVEYIRDNYTKDLNMAVVSNEVSMNYTLFSAQFKQFTGSSFVNYVRDLRLSEAKRLLSETDMRVNDIGTRVGYDNEKHFLKSFKATVGVTPSEYRRNSNR